MTLRQYSPDQLDKLSLEILDIATHIRNIHKMSQDNNIENIELHDKKAIDWLDNIRNWARRAEAQAAVQVHDILAQRKQNE